MPLHKVTELVIGFLVDRIPLNVDSAKQKQEINRLVQRWGPLIPAIGGTDGKETVAYLQVCWKRSSDKLNQGLTSVPGTLRKSQPSADSVIWPHPGSVLQ